MAKRKVETSLANLLAVRLRAHLDSTKEGVPAFARKANVSSGTVYQILSGKGTPSAVMVARLETAMRAGAASLSEEAPPLDAANQELLGVILEEALEKKALDRLIQHVLRAAGEAGGEKTRAIAESLLVAHLKRFEGTDRARELLKLHLLTHGD